MGITKIKSDEHWHKMRATTIGGSEVGIIFGCSPYGTKHELYVQKKKLYEKTFEDNPLVEFGNDMEPIIAKYVAREMNWEIVRSEDYYIHPEHTFLGTTLDYYVVQSEDGPGLLEIKNVNAFAPDWTDSQAPAHIEMQMQHQFLVVNAAREAAGLEPFTWGAIGSLHGGNPNDIRVFKRKPDTKLHDFIIKECGQFWEDIKNGVEPELFGGDKELDHIIKMFKAESTEALDIDYLDKRDDLAINDMIIQYDLARQRALDEDKKKEELKARILKEMMCIKDDGVIKHTCLRTANYIIEANVRKVNRKAQPASVSSSLGFKITELEEK